MYETILGRGSAIPERLGNTDLMDTMRFLPGVNLPQLPSRTEVKNACSFTSYSAVCLHGFVLGHGDHFTLPI
jgi:hypothetical protein